MKRSRERILTTHTGSLPRSPGIAELVMSREESDVPPAPDDWSDALDAEVGRLVERQIEAGIDVVSDGEASKHSYARYVRHRLTGFSDVSDSVLAQSADLEAYPEFADLMRRIVGDGARAYRSASCVAPIRRADDDGDTAADIQRLLDAVAGTDAEAFITSASPGLIALSFRNDYYDSHEDYLVAIADAMRPEYEAIAAAGLILQLDCPDLAMGAHGSYRDMSLEEFRRRAALHVEVLNHATASIDPDRMRMHLCWGNYPGPHTHDVALADILDVVIAARPAALAFEAANPRHAHEWRVFEKFDLPDDKVLIPGVIDSTTNYVEHPLLVAERLERYARAVGRERVIAGSDCGFGTSVLAPWVVAEVVWAKLASLAEGARLASETGTA